MKKYITLFTILTSSINLIYSNAGTPPPNDDCANAIDGTGGVSGGTNACATADDALCGTQGEATVWYFYDVSAELASLEIVVAPGSMNNPAVAFYSACGTFEDEDCSGSLTMTCLMPGTYYIQVGSETADEGDFDINFTEVTSISESDCNNAIQIAVTQTCVFENFSGSTQDACPEASNFGSGCDFTGNETVWFEYTVGSNTSSIDLDNLSSNLELAFLDGPCGSDQFGCISGTTNIAVTPGQTYWIAATLTTGGGGFDFDLRENETPPNNDCTSATDIQSGENQTTCCATGGGGCGNAGVWFVYAFPDGDGSIFTLNNVSVSGDIGIEIYSGSCGGNLEFSDCGGGPFTAELAHCDGDFYIHVTSEDDMCGDFDLSVTPLVGCTFGEDCGSGPVLAPTTNGPADCADGCTQYSCDGECASNGVWFEVQTDDLATAMNIQVNASNGFDPVVNVYQVTCGDSDQNIIACQSADSDIDLAVSGNISYFIEVASTGTPGDFELCILTTESQDLCAETTLSSIDRLDYPDEDPEGPYCPGETVNFCFDVEFTIDAIGTGNNCQWLQGLVPTVGGGWDLAVNPINGPDDGPGGSWFWLAEGSVVYGPNASFSHPRYELITTANGDAGLNFGPGGLAAGDALPGGWWFVSGGNGPNCTNDGNPNTMWGLPGGCGSGYTVEVCFDLTVKELDDIAQCSDPDFTDLSVSLFTFADGQTGCWSNNTCGLDIAGVQLGEMDCSSLVELMAEDEEICNEECLAILVETIDGSPADIFVTVVDEGNTSGAEDHEFSNGAGTINDCIENLGTSIEVVTYEAYGLLPPSVCAGPIIEIQVIVYPEIEIEVEEPYYICYNMPTEITPEVSGGDGGPYTYNWEDGSSESSITLPEPADLAPGEYEIILEVTDGSPIGCSKQQIIEYVILEPIIPEIVKSADAACKNGIDDMVEMELIFNDTGNGPYEFEWSSQPNGLDFLNGDDENPVIIDDESSTARTYTVLGTVIDAFGCEYTAETTFTVDNGPDIVFEIVDCMGGEYALSGYEIDGLQVTFEMYYDADGDWVFDGTTIDNAELVNSTFGNVIGYNTSDPGTYILLGISANGCVDFTTLDVLPIPTPEFAALPDSTVCNGTTVNISITNAALFEEIEWSTGIEDDNITVTPSDTTTYYVELVTPDDCELIDSIRINVNPEPEIVLSGSTSFCPGTSTTLSLDGPPTFTYTWTSPSNQIVTGQSIQVSEAGIWNFEITSDLGCVSMDQVTVEESSNLEFEIVGDNLCTGDVVTLDGGVFNSYLWSTGETTRTIEVTVGGTYSLEVSDGNCNGTDEITVIEVAPLDVALNAFSTTVCNADTGGDPTMLDLTSFETGINGQWFDQNGFPINNPNEVDFEGQAPATISYLFSTNAATPPCNDEDYPFEITIQDCSCPSVEINAPQNFCIGPDTFDLNLIKVTPEAGTWSVMPASMNIVNNELLISDDNTVAGQYTLVFTLDTPGPQSCPEANSVEFTVFSPPEAELDLNVSVCNADTGNGPDFIDLDDLYISGLQGVWSTNEPGISIDANNVVSFTGQNVGDYTFFYFIEEPGSACDPKTIQVPVRVRDCNCPDVDIINIPNLCSSDGEHNLNDFLTNPDSEPGVWSITNGPANDLLIGNSLFVGTDAPAGEYEVTYTLTNSFGASCQTSFTQTFNVFGPPMLQYTELVTVCNGTNITVFPSELNLNTLVDDPTGTWFDPDGNPIADPTLINFIGQDPEVLVYRFITDTAQRPCQEQEIEVEIEIVNCNCPPIIILPPMPFCSDEGPVNLDDLLDPIVESGTWTYIDNEPNVNLVGSSLEIENLDGIYTFQYTLDNVPNGCTDFNRVALTIDAFVDVDFQNSAEVCNVPSQNGPSCLDFNSFVRDGTQGDWTVAPNFNGDFSDLSNVCFEGYDIGETFEFIFTANPPGSVCPDQDLSFTVTVIDCDCPNLTTIAPMPICNEATDLDLSNLQSSGIVAGAWSVVDGPQSLDIVSNSINLDGIAEGVYTLRYTPQDQQPAGCPEFSEQLLEVFNAPFAGDASTIEFCENEDNVINLEGLLDNEDQGGSWIELSSSTGSAFDATSGEFSIVGQRAGTYIFEYLVPANGPCDEASQRVEVIINQVPVADAGEDITLDCDNPDLVIGTNGSGGTSTGNDIVYEWYLNGVLLQNETERTLMATTVGVYELVVTNVVTACSDSDEVEVFANTEVPVYQADVTPADCENLGAIVVSSISGGSGNYMYSIDGGITFFESGEFENLQPGTYTLIIQDDNGCETAPDEIIIIRPDDIEVYAGEDRDVDFGNEQYTLEAATSTDLGEIVRIVWTENGNVICEDPPEDCSVISVDPDLVSEYCVEIEDVNGCVATDCVVLRERIVRDVYIANTFDPSSTNNNIFFVQTDEFIESIDEFRIFDRWGEKVFEAESPHPPNDPSFGWDGTFKDKPVEQGVYVYYIKLTYRNADGLQEEFAGDVTIFR